MERVATHLGLISLLLAALAGALGGGGAVGLYALHKLQRGTEDLPRWPYIASACIYGAVSGAPTAMLALSAGRPWEEALGWSMFAGTIAVAGALGVQMLALKVVREIAQTADMTATGLLRKAAKPDSEK